MGGKGVRVKSECRGGSRDVVDSPDRLGPGTGTADMGGKGVSRAPGPGAGAVWVEGV